MEIFSIDFSVDNLAFESIFLQNPTCEIWQPGFFSMLGTISFTSEVCAVSSETTLASKRSSETEVLTDRPPKQSKRTSNVDGATYRAGPDMISIFKDLNLVQEIPNNLQCTLCPYKATRKGNLKVHYQMEHLGGHGVSATCF